MIERTAIVNEARRWLGTPFADKGRVRGIGVDCAGLIIGVAKALEISDFDTTAYGLVPKPKIMGAILREKMHEIPISEATIADVVWIAWERLPQHLAILSDIGLIHAHENGVVEHPLDATYRGKVRAAYRFPGVA